MKRERKRTEATVVVLTSSFLSPLLSPPPPPSVLPRLGLSGLNNTRLHFLKPYHRRSKSLIPPTQHHHKLQPESIIRSSEKGTKICILPLPFPPPPLRIKFPKPFEEEGSTPSLMLLPPQKKGENALERSSRSCSFRLTIKLCQQGTTYRRCSVSPVQREAGLTNSCHVFCCVCFFEDSTKQFGTHHQLFLKHFN